MQNASTRLDVALPLHTDHFSEVALARAIESVQHLAHEGVWAKWEQVFSFSVFRPKCFNFHPDPAGEEGFVEANAVDEVDFERERAQGGEKEVKPWHIVKYHGPDATIDEGRHFKI